jgi:glycosyltransferase involved in cell wall biosynthesis
MSAALESDPPDAVAVSGYVRPECLAALGFARRARVPCVLMSESQAIDRPRAWWKERIKAARVSRFDAALVGGPSHRDYLVSLGIPAERIALGYNAVDHEAFAAGAARARASSARPAGQPARPYFLTVCRFVPEKNLGRLVAAHARYREQTAPGAGWDLVLCGDGPEGQALRAAAEARGIAGHVHFPGFLQADGLVSWYAHAGAFVLASVSEPWGLVANEAAACGLPLLISSHAGCARTLVPGSDGSTGMRFDPLDIDDLTDALGWVGGLDPGERQALGQRAEALARCWGPERFAEGLEQALALAAMRRRRSRQPVRSEGTDETVRSSARNVR